VTTPALDPGITVGISDAWFQVLSPLNNNGDALETNDVIVSDSVQLTLTDDNTHKDVIEALVEFFGSARQNMLIIGDDLSTATEYFSPLISGVGTISVAAVVAS